MDKLIKEIYRENRVSKNGKEYQMLVIVFQNQYKLEVFLSNEQQWILQAIPLNN